MFILAGGYYVNVAGGGMISNIITGNISTQETLLPLNKEQIPGIYICNTTATCTQKYTLLLKEDSTAELKKTQNYNENQTAENIETVENEHIEKGIWDIGVQNMLIITLTEKDDILYEKKQKIVIKNVKEKTLSKISYTKNNYKDIHTMIFIKKMEEEQ